MTHCVIILPELLTVPVDSVADLQLPALESILSQGKFSKVEDRCVEQSLMRHFGYAMPTATALPAAKIRWAADFNIPAPEYCVCADPVHMLADIDHARLMDASSLKLSVGECEQYISALNKVFAEDGLEFVFASPDRWYLSGQDASMLQTLPTKSLVGRNVASFLPEGDESAHWRTVSTEVQMLLFSNSQNQTREAQGQLTLNALWLWGGGHYEKPTGASPEHVYSNDTFCQGLAKLTQVPVEPLSDCRFESIKGKALLLMDGRGMDAIIYGNYADWLSWITELENSTFKPLWRAFKKGQIERITLNAGNGREYTVTKSRWPSFLRRRKALRSYVSEISIELSE